MNCLRMGPLVVVVFEARPSRVEGEESGGEASSEALYLINQSRELS